MIRPDQWSPADGLSLEPNALRAVRETDHNLALTAGPGAGKSEMLAQRADFLLRTGACRYPSRILAISFKVDASQNLRARVAKRSGHELSGRFDSHTFHAFSKRLIDSFRLALEGDEALDPDYTIGAHRVQGKSITFGDMVPLATKIVATSLIARNAIQSTYRFVFLDEFQDCTGEQYELIRSSFVGTSTRLIAVGDTKQRIMGWAGALDGIFRTFATDFEARPLNLYQNFRAQPRLRRMQNAMIKVMDPPAAVDDRDLPGNGGEIEIWEFESDDAEAQVIASKIKSWIEEEGVRASEVAILVSKQQHLYCQKLYKRFRDEGIPYREEDAAQDLASEPACSLVLDFLLVVSRSSQPEPFRRLLDLIVFSQGLDDEAEYRQRSRWDRFIASTEKKIAERKIQLDKERDLTELVSDLVDLVGKDIVVSLSSDYGYGTRLAEVLAATTDRVLALLEREKDVSKALASFSGDQAVRVMSIHKSKGLEFNSVIVLGVENETFWGKKDEERAAYFVAVSRAKHRLVLTTCETRARPEKANQWKVNRTQQKEFLGYAEAYSA